MLVIVVDGLFPIRHGLCVLTWGGANVTFFQSVKDGRNGGFDGVALPDVAAYENGNVGFDE